jgi:putative lipoprotein (rSAM/lipoprotein system)
MIKTMHRSFIKGTNWILAGILSILGFSGCNDVNIGTEEYGAPHTNFSFHGTVINATKDPVKGIQIEIGTRREGYVSDSILTNESGQYSTTLVLWPNEEDFQVIVSDVDGEENGSYQNDTIPVKITKDDYYEQGHGEWYYGAATKKVDVLLKDKE